MRKEFIEKLRSEYFLSATPCEKGLYLTFDAMNALPIKCRYSEVVIIPLERLDYYKGPEYPGFMIVLSLSYHLMNIKIRTGLFAPSYYYDSLQLVKRPAKLYPCGNAEGDGYSYTNLIEEVKRITIKDKLRAIIIPLDEIKFLDDPLKVGEERKFCLSLKKMAKELNLIIFVFLLNNHLWDEWKSATKLIWLERGGGDYANETETAGFFD